ncbi:abc transporter c family member 3 [Quercus suber]|uniref:Abc transporter c family member 3 n=1 Tax=Quercus suber TaxID=58331 RepID=A0AAW0M2P1_QUESU
MSILFSHYYSLIMSSGTDFLMKPVLLRGFSGSLHLLLLFVLFTKLVCNKFKVGHSEGPKERFKNIRNGWSDEGLVTLLDLALRTLAWGAPCVYLRTQLFNSDVVLYREHVSLPVQNLVSDVMSVILGLFFRYVGFSGKEGEDTLLEEPLLNGDSNTSNEVESNKSKGSENVTPYLNAGFFGILTFSWMGPLIEIGNKKTLDLEDVPQLGPSDSVFGAFPTFKNKLEAECGTSNGVTTLKLAKSLIYSARKEILLAGLNVLAFSLASYVGPYLIETFVQYLNGRRQYKNEGYVLVSVFFAAKLVECISQRHWFFWVAQVGIRVRSVLIALIYNKGLTLSCQSKQGHTSGEIINFMTVDADRVADFSGYIHETWMILVQVVIAMLLLYKNLGLASIAALVATILVMLANVPLGRLQEKFQDKLMESKDKRMKATSEILRNMRILKLQGWEMKFLSKIMELRGTEAGWLKKFLYTSAFTSFVFWGAPTFVSVVTFGSCVLMGIPLESGKILSALATFGILQEPIYSLPDTISMIAQTKVSLDRIVSFLCLDDLQSDVIERLPRGKSSLISCILGEVPKISGTVKLCGTKAYVAQSPWIQSGKIEENILFEDVKPSVDSSTLMIVYVALAIGSSFCVLVRSMLIRTAEYSTANQLRKMHFCIFCAPMSFFDATPSGRILSRASTDQNAVDLSILNEMGAVAFSVIQLLGIILVMSQAAWQVFIILSQLLQPVSSISNIRYLLQELSRLVGVCKAPVIQHFTETISGATTIRSFDEESRFRDTNMKLADANSRPRFNIAGAMEWLCFPLDMLSSITFVFSLFFLISIPEGVIDPG